jgi:hypothetical protein
VLDIRVFVFGGCVFGFFAAVSLALFVYAFRFGFIFFDFDWLAYVQIFLAAETSTPDIFQLIVVCVVIGLA